MAQPEINPEGTPEGLIPKVSYYWRRGAKWIGEHVAGRHPQTAWRDLGAAGKTLRSMKIAARATLLAVPVAIPAYFIAGQFWGSVNSELLPDHQISERSSKMVDTAARILERERASGWGPSARITPLWTRTDVSAYQRGLLSVLVKVSQEFNHSQRIGDQSSANNDLAEAANDIDRPADKWSILSANSTFDRLGDAVKRFDNFNERLASGTAPQMSSRINVASQMVNDFLVIMSQHRTNLRNVIENGNFLIGVRAPFYEALGAHNGMCLMVEAMQKDLGKVLEFQSSVDSMNATVDVACSTIGITPLPVFNGKPFGRLPAHVQSLAGVLDSTMLELGALQQALAGASVSTPRGMPSRAPGRAP